MRSISKRFHAFTLLRSNERGIALLIVLSSLAVLTTAIVEFTYNSRINYRLAVQAKEELQAAYLARSALNLSKIVLKYSKEAQSMMDKMTDASGTVVHLEPLYRMVPLSSDLLRGILSGEITGEELAPPSEEGASEEEGAPKEEGEPAGPTEEEEAGSDIQAGVGLLDKEKAAAFLDFDGDFESEILEEQTRFDLNRLSGMEPASKTYDQRKKLLLSILLLPDFKNLFENQEREAETLVHAIGDWVDADGVSNEFDNIQRGNEDSLYSDAKYHVKSGKMTTLSELRLVKGMSDKIYEALIPYVSVYSASDKINACLADESMMKALIYHYTQNSGCAPPVKYEDEDKLKDLLAEVTSACPNPESMAAALNSKLGLSDLDLTGDSGDEDSGATAKEGEAVSGCAFQFKDLLAEDNNVFTIKGKGIVGETEVTVTVAVNAESKNPSQWKYYYYRIE